MKQKIKCIGCGKVIATGQLPANIEIKCSKCKAINDLSQVRKEQKKPFYERQMLEKK